MPTMNRWPLDAFMSWAERSVRWPGTLAWNLFQAAALHKAYLLGATPYQPNRWGKQHRYGRWVPGCRWWA
jgi:hypothetical protein